MSNQLVIKGLDNLPSINLPESVIAKVQAQFADAAKQVAGGGVPRMTFAGNTFHLTFGDSTTDLDERVLDVYLVGVNPQFHYTFFEKTYAEMEKEGASNARPKMLSRFPTEDDDWQFEPTEEWHSRVYKQRAIVMLPDTLDYYVADFGYNSVKKTGNPQLGIFSFSQLLSQMNYITQQSKGAVLPFMIKVQMSFSKKATVPELQFSLFDQKSNDRELRFADNEAIEKMAQLIASGEIDELLTKDFGQVIGGEEPNEEKTPADNGIVEL